MAYIEFVDDKRIEYLREYHTMGRRAETVDTNLDYPFVSKLHAVLEWKNPNWLIRDVSQNGIWVNGVRLKQQTNHQLDIDDLVEIAGSNGISFIICNLDKPQDMIYQENQILEQIILSESLLLPNEDTPEYGLYKCPDRLQWFSEEIKLNQRQNIEITEDDEHPYESGPYNHGDVIQCEKTKWCFFLVHVDAATTEFRSEQADISDVNFRFDISQDEETTTLTLSHEHKEIDLGERSHHYLLAHLLRFKASQIKSNNNLNEAGTDHLGWINCELLAKELGIDEAHMNIQIFRVRKQITSEMVGYRGSSHIIERRRGSVRAGIIDFSIYKEGLLET